MVGKVLVFFFIFLHCNMVAMELLVVARPK